MGVIVAHIARAWGNKGEVTADLLTDFPERFDDLAGVTLRRGAEERAAEIERHWFHKGRVVLKFAGVDSISDAERLAGFDVLVADDEVYELPEGEDLYYDFDLIGCLVQTPEGESVGTVESVMRPGGGDLLRVRTSGGREVLIPFVDE